MGNLLDSLLTNPRIVIGIVVFLLFFAIVSIIKKLLKVGIIILIFIILIGAGAISVKNTQEKYDFSFQNGVISATVEGKKVSIDFNKLEGAKIEANKVENGISLSITYKNGNTDAVVVPNFMYQLVKLKAKLSEINLQPPEINLNNG